MKDFDQMDEPLELADGKRRGLQLELVDEETEAYVKALGAGIYFFPCRVRGELVCLGKMLLTVGIVCGIDDGGYRVRYCYEDGVQALQALLNWGATTDEEPKGFIKRK